MGISLTQANSITITKPVTLVYVNGSVRRDMELASLSKRMGLGGSHATLTMPLSNADDDFDDVAGQEVVCYAYHYGGYAGTPVFRGIIRTPRGHLTARSNRAEFEAVSSICMLDLAHVGQNTHNHLWEYLRKNPATGNENNWTLELILKDMFSATNFPTYYATKIALGSTYGLHVGRAGMIINTNVKFSCASYKDALQTILQIAGNIGIRERFESDKTYLDFYPLGPDYAAARTWDVAQAGESVTDGSCIAEFQTQWDYSGIRTRAIGYGAPPEIAITIAHDHATKPLAGAWSLPTYPTGTGDTLVAESSFTTIEKAVLKNPEISQPEKENFDPDHEKVYRHFAIPAELKKHVIMSHLPVRDEDGRFLPLQAFIYPRTYEQVSEGGFTKWKCNGVSLTPRHVSIERIDPEEGIIILSDPAVEVFEQYCDSTNSTVTIFRPAAVSVTLGFQLKDPSFYYDTGVCGWSGPAGYGTDGLTEIFQRTDLRYSQATSENMEIIPTGGGSEIIWPCVYFDGTDWTTISAATAIENDALVLKNVTEFALRERLNARRTCIMGLPIMATRLAIGDSLRINCGASGENQYLVQVQAVSIDCISGNSVVQASDQVPLTLITQSGDPFTRKNESNLKSIHDATKAQWSGGLSESAPAAAASIAGMATAPLEAAWNTIPVQVVRNYIKGGMNALSSIKLPSNEGGNVNTPGDPMPPAFVRPPYLLPQDKALE